MPRTSKKSLLRDKGESTKFHILMEIMRHQPHVKQKDISDSMGITIQAVSKYFKGLMREGLLEAGSERADYRLTPKAMIKLTDELRALENFVDGVRRDLKIDRAWPALATRPVKADQEVGLVMEGGVILTVSPDDPASQAKAVAINDAQPGEDLGLKDIKGKIHVKKGKILIVKLPSIRKGGSRSVDLEKVKSFYEEFRPDRVGVMGAVGRAVLNKLGLKPNIEFGLSRSSAIAASRGLNVFILVVGRMVNRMIEEIDSINTRSLTEVSYEIKDAQVA